jgi:hypothetical protein
VEAVQRGLLMVRDTLQVVLDGMDDSVDSRSGGAPASI